VRDAAQADLALQRGAIEIAVGDLRDVRSLEDAAKGVYGVFHIGPAFLPDEVFPLEKAPEAQRRLENRESIGKIVLKIES
jgi:uncharacterized protein YbjT (DUF2867 family)